jgi:biotin transporter BioY
MADSNRTSRFEKTKTAANMPQPVFSAQKIILSISSSRVPIIPVGVTSQFHAGLLACASAFYSPSQVISLSGYE